MRIFSDVAKTKEVDLDLIENQTYILDFESEETEAIYEEIQKSKLLNFIQWQAGNRYGKLCISNYIGNIFFFNKTYDVKSSKFLTELKGSEQFRKLLNDIQQLSRNIIFSYTSPSFAIRQVDYKDTNPNTLLIFNYFKKIILDWDSNMNLKSSIDRVLKNPNFKYFVSYEKDKIEKVKKVDNKTIKLLFNKTTELAKVEIGQDHIFDLPLTKFLSTSPTHRYFPTKTYIRKNNLKYDTVENRFIKYFLRYVAGFAYKLNFVKNLPESVILEKELILSFCRKMLNKPFFKNIGEMNLVPVNSTVLQSRAGYKEILSHYSRSRFGIKHIFEQFEKDALSIDLKKISDLYEYWVFYRIAKSFLGNEIIIEQQDLISEDGTISYSICFKNDITSVYYNKTESKSKKSSYSVNFRPDTTVIVKKNDKEVKFIFDAKYKIKKKNDKEDIERHVKPEDIHKMHAYVDAIENAKFAIVVYPGTEFYFYERDVNNSIRKSVEEIEIFEGVGAIPLIPENNNHYEMLDLLVQKINESIFDY